MAYRLLVGSYTDSLFVLTFLTSEESGDGKASLTLSSAIRVGHHPSWISNHPLDHTVIFTVLEQSEGRIISLKLDPQTLQASVIDNASTSGADPCTILVAEHETVVGNYSSGTVSFFKLTSAAISAHLEIAQPPLQFSGSGPDRSRQATSHPHQVYLHQASTPLGQHEILIPDLGADRTWRLMRNASGAWEQYGEIFYRDNLGGGPRHVAVYDDILYTLLELSSTIVAHTLPPLPATPNSASSVPILLASSPTLIPPPLPVTDPNALPLLAAEILIPLPNSSFPTAYIYVSNRNEVHPDGDTITIFETFTSSSVIQDAKSATDSNPSIATLKHIASSRTGLHHLRGMIFFGPDDRYLIAGGAQGGGIKVFERIDGGRNLKEIAFLPVVEGGDQFGLRPTAFLCI